MKSLHRTILAATLAATASAVNAGPQDGVVVAGEATISHGATSTTIQQNSQNAVIDWQSFNIGRDESVRLNQPNSTSVALNRVLGGDPSSIFGTLSANGRVFLINPEGILFGADSSVNVGGLLASTRDISTDDFMAGRWRFEGSGNGSVQNQGNISADGGFVTLLGAQVANDGTIAARLGSVSLAAGDAFTLDMAGDGLLNVTVDKGTLDALARNGGLLAADGGHVLMTAHGAGALLPSAVNNSGVIRAQGTENRDGVIRLLGDMKAGTASVGGLLDASAPVGGNGGFIETSAAQVHIAPDAGITTLAARGNNGTWLIDPPDFTVAASGGDMTGAQLSTALGAGNVVIQSAAGAAGVNGDIHVNDSVSWSANRLTLDAWRNINVNTTMNGSGSADLTMNYGLGAVAAGNAARITLRAPVNLPGGNHYTTRLGSDGAPVNFTVINDMTAVQNITSNRTTNYALGSDLDATAVSFVPIGPMTAYNDYANMYSATFDGLGHSISNLTINRPVNNFVGMFSGITTTATVRNLGLVNANVTGLYDVGSIVGLNYGTVSDVYASGAVAGSDQAGGLLGYSAVPGSLSRSYSEVSVSNRAGASFDATAGGLVGWNQFGTIQDSLSTGSVTGRRAGGIVGTSSGGSVTNNLAMGAVSGDQGQGGLVAWTYFSPDFTNSYWNTTTTGMSGGLTTAQLQAALPSGLSNSVWGNGHNQATPYLLGLTSNRQRALLSSEPGSSYYRIINTAEGLQSAGDTLAGRWALGVDIDARATANWNSGAGFTPIGNGGTPFTGRFDGLTHIITGLSINRPASSDQGLFGATSGADLLNIGLEGVNITAQNNVGALAGQTLLGTVKDSHVTGNVSGQDSVGGLIGYMNTTQTQQSYSAADVSGSARTGGLMGATNGGTFITSTFATGNVTGAVSDTGGLIGHLGFATVISDSYATGAVSGADSVGGLVGYSGNGLIQKSYSTGAVWGNTQIGGLLGNNAGGSSIDSYWDITASGQGTSALGTGLTHAQMQQQASFTGLDFSSAWTIYQGNTMPLLRAFMSDLDVRPADVSRTYDGLAYAGGSAIYSLVPDPAHLHGTPLFGSTGVDAGSSSITVDGLYSDQLGYLIHFIDGNQVITPRSITLAGSRAYDGTTDAAAGMFTLNGLLNSDTLMLSGSGTTGRNVGVGQAVAAGSLVLQDGTGLAANYTLDLGLSTAAITPASLTLRSTDVVRTYDGGLGAAGSAEVSAGTLFSGDSLSGGVFAFTDANAGSGNKTVTLTGVIVNDGNGGANYTVGYQANTSSTINRAALSAAAVAGNKTYDGSNAANATLTVLNGLVGPETVGVTVTGATFNSANVATASTVTVDSLTLSNGTNGGLASNYSLSAGQSTAASITPRALTATAVAADKTYDGNTAASAALGALTGLVGSETVNATVTGATFNSANVATADTVTVNTLALSDGAHGGLASNYSLTAGQTTTASIIPRALTASASAAGKTYDGSAAASAILTVLNGLVGPETVGVTVNDATFNSANVATASTVTVNSLALSNGANGGLASNYSLSAGQTAAGRIMPKVLTALAGAADKTYDGTTAVSASLNSLTGFVGSETVNAAVTGATFNSANVTTANTVTVNSLALSNGTNGGLASNYSLNAGQTVMARIIPRSVSVVGAVAQGKEYDGTTAATLRDGLLVGVLPGDSVGFHEAGVFGQVLGLDLPVTSTISLTGAGSSNYTLVQPFGLAASILPPGRLPNAVGYPAALAAKPYVEVARSSILESYDEEDLPLTVENQQFP